MSKELVADFELDLGVVPDNLEALTFGPLLPDGRLLMIAVSDNNFNPSQTTQVIALAVELGPAG
jgi:3-phytase